MWYINIQILRIEPLYRFEKEISSESKPGQIHQADITYLYWKYLSPSVNRDYFHSLSLFFFPL